MSFMSVIGLEEIKRIMSEKNLEKFESKLTPASTETPKTSTRNKKKDEILQTLEELKFEVDKVSHAMDSLLLVLEDHLREQYRRAAARQFERSSDNNPEGWMGA